VSDWATVSLIHEHLTRNSRFSAWLKHRCGIRPQDRVLLAVRERGAWHRFPPVWVALGWRFIFRLPCICLLFSFPSAVAAVASWLGGGVGALGFLLDWGGGTATGLSVSWAPFIPDVRSCRDFRRPNPNCSRLDSSSFASLLRLTARGPCWAWGSKGTRNSSWLDFFGYFSIRGDSCQGIRDFHGDFMG